MAKIRISRRKRRALHKSGLRARNRGPVVFGSLKKSFRTKSGKVIKNPTSWSAANRVSVRGWDGKPYKTTARLASRMIRNGEIPYQIIGRLRRA